MKNQPTIKTERRPGELGFLALLAVMLTALFADSLRLPGLISGELSSPSSVPQVMLLAALALVAALAASYSPPVEGWREAPGWSGNPRRLRAAPPSAEGGGALLLNKEVATLLSMVFVYAIILPLLRFEISTMIFLTATMYLLERENPVKKLIISAAVVTVISVMFRVLMRVVLP